MLEEVNMDGKRIMNVKEI